MFRNGRPLSQRQLLKLMAAMAALCFATQTLLSQWGYGAELGGSGPVAANHAIATDVGVASQAADTTKFMAPRPAAAAIGGTLELRSAATVTGGEVRLKQVARWSNRDAALFQEPGELILLRLDPRQPYGVIDLNLVRKTLGEAGVNASQVKFVGPMECTVNRSDTKPDREAALSKWIEANENPITAGSGQTAGLALPSGSNQEVPTVGSAVSQVGGPAAARPVAAIPVTNSRSTREAPASGSLDQTTAVRPAVRRLRDLIMDELSSRLNVAVEVLQVSFRPQDERLLNLCEPQFRFGVEAPHGRALGEMMWNITIAAESGTQKAQVVAQVRVWQVQTVVNRPIAARAPINETDVLERRTLIERLDDEPLLSLQQAIGQQASRDLKPGTVLTGRMVEPVPLARTGQLVTVTLGQGSVRIKTVVRALEGGSRGQRIRVKNESTSELFDVVLTGPQEAEMGTAG